MSEKKEDKKIQVYFGLFQTLGDIIVSTALIRTIKKKYPTSEITYAVGAQYIDVLAGNEDITTVIPCQHPHEIVLRSNEKPFDKVYLPLMLTQEDTLWHQRPEWCIDNGDNHNLVDMYAAKCQDDLVVEERKTYLYPTDKHWEQIVEAIPEESREAFTSTPYITVHTTSRNPSKDWDYNKFAELCVRIKEKYPNMNIVQVGGPDDKNLPAPVVVIKETPLLNTAAIIKRAKLHIDIDSGPSFIADSLDIPTICIMGATWSQTSGPIGPSTHFIEPDRHCLDKIHTPCHTHCPIAPECIDSISVDEVLSVVVDKLGES